METPLYKSPGIRPSEPAGVAQEETDVSTPKDVEGQLAITVPSKHLRPDAETKIDIKGVNFFYGSKQALYGVSLPVVERKETALIGPSGCCKTPLFRTLNRMNDLLPRTRTGGDAIID